MVVINMPMPKGCGDCNLRDFGDGYCPVFCCPEQEEIDKNAETRPEWCPLSEVKSEEEKQADRNQKRREWQAKYRETHRQQAYQTTKEWRKNNPDKVKAQRARYRERKRMRKDGDGDV